MVPVKLKSKSDNKSKSAQKQNVYVTFSYVNQGPSVFDENLPLRSGE